MEVRHTTIAAIVIACTAAGAGGTWLLGGGPAEAPGVVGAAAAGRDVVLAAPVEAPPHAASTTVEPQAPAAAPVAAPRPARPAATPAPAVASHPPNAGPATVAAVDRIRALPTGTPPDTGTSQPVQVDGLRVEFDELVVGADAVIGLRLDTTVSSATALVEDPVEAVVTRDVLVGGRVAVPAGSRVHGSVTLVDTGGRLRDPARLRVRFSDLTLPDGTRIDIDSDPIYREGDAPGNESAAAIGGGAVGGAILGGILGGARGAIIGGTAGAGAGTAVAMAGRAEPVVLTSGTPVTIRLLRPFAVVVER